MKAGLVMGHLGCILPPGVGGILRLIFGRSLEKRDGVRIQPPAVSVKERRKEINGRTWWLQPWPAGCWPWGCSHNR